MLEPPRPIQELESEKAILALALFGAGNSAELVADKVRPEWFFSRRHRLILDVVLVVLGEHGAVDLALVAQRLDPELFESTEAILVLEDLRDFTPLSESLDAHAGAVREAWQSRVLSDELLTAQNQLREHGSNPGNVARRIRTAIDRLDDDDDRVGPRSSAEIAREIEDQIRNVREGVSAPIKCGLYDLDSRLAAGGFQPGELTLIGARPSVGKSALLNQIARHAAYFERVPSLVFSLEVLRGLVLLNMAASHTGADATKARRSWVLNNGNKNGDLVAQGLKDLRSAPLYIDDSTTTIEAVEMRARRYVRSSSVRLITIDYVQLLSSEQRFESRHQELAYVSRRLKRLAVDLDVVVVCAAQLNRDLSKGQSHGQPKHRAPSLSDFKDCGALEQDCDVALLLRRRETESESDRSNPMWRGLAEVAIAKQRNGAQGFFKLHFDGCSLSYHQRAPEWREAAGAQ